MIWLLYVLVVIALIVGSYTDFKRREVPDWVSYGLIASALGVELIYSIINSDYSIILYGMLGFVAMFLLANLLYFAKQWGGGDSKILMGIGAVLGLNPVDMASYLNFAVLFLLIIFIGAFYGILFSIYLAVKSKKRFIKEFKENFHDFKYLEIFAVLFLIFGIVFVLINYSQLSYLVFGVSVIFFIGIVFFVFVKSVEEGCLLRMVKANKLTEGDWVLQDIRVKGKLVVSKDNPGITKTQLNRLKTYKKLILMKEGIPFIPAFLLAFIAFILAENWLISLLKP